MPCKMERYFFYLLYLLLGCSLCGCSRKQAPKQTQDPDTETTIPYADTIAAPVPPAPAKSRTARYLDSLGFVNIAEADSSIAIDLMYTRFTQPKNAGNANLVGVELSYQRDFSFIAPALKCVGFYGTYTYTHSRVEDFNFEGRENEKDLSMPGSPEHTANASLYFEKGGLNLRLSYNFASDFIDEMGESTFYDRYYDKVNYMDVNASYTFGKKFKTTFYAEANNLLNQPLRYYQGTKDRTMQAEYYGVKVNAGVKINF